DRGAEKKRAEAPQYTAEPFGLVGLLGGRLERAPAREQLHFEELPFSSADRMSSTGSCVRKRRASSFTQATEPGLTGELSSAAMADSWTRRSQWCASSIWTPWGMTGSGSGPVSPSPLICAYVSRNRRSRVWTRPSGLSAVRSARNTIGRSFVEKTSISMQYLLNVPLWSC